RTGPASSRTTADGSLPISTPLKAAWRTRPSRVHSANSARITIRGSTQWTRGSRGAGLMGGSVRSMARNDVRSSRRVRVLLLLPRGLQKRLSIGLDVRGEVHHGVRLERPAQQRLAVLERNVEQ